MNELTTLVSSTEGASRAAALRQRFREAAEAAGSVDVAVGSMDSPVGALFLAVTPRGVLHIGFPNADHDVTLREISTVISPRIVGAAHATDEVRRELDQYFSGERTTFSLRLDRRLMTPFAREVLAATAAVPFGATTTYGDIASRIHRPGAARAVGAALGSNPIPIVVPCHRVVGAGGALTGYGGGLERKVYLLQLESQPTLDTFA
jgi:methylated-DNA-[protein]-cysteine S-methyltransferase